MLTGKEFYDKNGFVRGEGWISMVDEDVRDAHRLDTLMNFNTSQREQFPRGIGYIPYRGKNFVVCKLGDGRIVVVGIKEAHLVEYDGRENIFTWEF